MINSSLHHHDSYDHTHPGGSFLLNPLLFLLVFLFVSFFPFHVWETDICLFIAITRHLVASFVCYVP